MEFKFVIVIITILLGLLLDNAEADFYFNRPFPNVQDHPQLKLKCAPGRTVMKIVGDAMKLNEFDSDSDESNEKRRQTTDAAEHCNMCICSLDGYNEYCIKRPVDTLNECLVIASTIAKHQRGEPYKPENSLSFRIRRVGDSLVDETQEEKNGPGKCVPYVSEYTDCTDENKCDPGCTKCTCSNKGQWNCQSIKDCSEVIVLEEESENTFVDDALFDDAINKLELEMKVKDQAEASDNPVIPITKAKKDASAELLDIISKYDVEAKLKQLSRSSRSTDKKIIEKASKGKTDNNPRHLRSNRNDTVKFYSTVDDLNEDILKNSTHAGTLLARRMESTLSDIARRSNIIDNNNRSLHVNLYQPKILNHIIGNKIDSLDQESKLDLDHEKLDIVLGNKTQKSKDKELSKLVVNELKNGVEIIGDSKAPVTSNISFTSQNDTLTAMAFIAGNLLNKLWNMEKDVSGSSLAIDDMKHEKISDLVDLFKEPLNLRQEDFLKSALEQLSNAIGKGKDIKNISLCQHIKNASKLIDKASDKKNEATIPPFDEHKDFENKTINKEDNNIQLATNLALSKINNVLGLMKKFERIQKNMSIMKTGTDFKKGVNITHDKNNFADVVLTKDETNTFNIFGDILDKITKLLMPRKSYRKMSNVIKSKNNLNNDHQLKNKVMKMYNVDLANMTVTLKDKLVLDYITHINNNPNCVINKNSATAETRILPSIEGNILLNLSEFFKIKSFSDLLNVLHTENKRDKIKTRNISTVTEIPTKMATIVIGTKTDKNRTNNKKKFEMTKEKLKVHLKTIIEDIIELQGAKGISHRGNLRIADALPCIYNIINANKDIFNKKKNVHNEMTDNIVNVLKNLKHTLKRDKTRRTDITMQVRPKSALVLERVIKNINPKPKSVTRRFDSGLLFPLEDVKTIINKVTNITSIYKNEGLFVEVPATDKIVSLKVLQRDINNYIKALEEIKRFYNKLSQLNTDEYREIYEFISNVTRNISLSRKVLNKMVNSKRDIISEEKKMNKISNTILLNHNLDRFSGIHDSDNDIKISRQKIINHLIKTRVQLYMKLKEAKGLDVNNDINYNIAKRIMFHLDNGNFNLANELYKILTMQKNVALDSPAGKNYLVPSSKIAESQGIMSRLQSLMQYEDQKTSNQRKLMDQNHLIKQFINLKNLRI